MVIVSPRPDAGRLLEDLSGLRAEIADHSDRAGVRLQAVHANHEASAHNLLHYLGLRRRDLRPLQLDLAALGLSSLGRAEPHVLATIDAVVEALRRITGHEGGPPDLPPPVDFDAGQRLLAEHRDALFGPPSPGRGVRIMVTMPSEAAHDYALVHALVERGMDCMRINCAHDQPAAWARMIEHLRRAERALERSCRVVMDLAGPKLRTGPVQPGPAIVRLRPERDVLGLVTAPARAWLTPAENPAPPPSPADACLPIDGEWLAELKVGEHLRFEDARGSDRSLWVVETGPQGCWAEATKTAYVVAGTKIRREHGQDASRSASVGTVSPTEGVMILHTGDALLVHRSLEPGSPATSDSAGRTLTPASIGCTIPAVFDEVRPGDPIWFDDGSIGGVVQEVTEDHALVRITHARPNGSKLRADKGINLPESPLRLSALTSKDLKDLTFVAAHADIVELSFANHASDIDMLQQEIARLGTGEPAIVIKVETRCGFDHLPDMLLAAMRSPRCGVMIARGDLAVECGFERLAEVQEEILWICEAAHVPVIWATQVLETLAKEGMPSRAEITDAAMGHRAECVMLNKGPHIMTAVTVLDDILRRMQAHQTKKRAMLRELRLAHTLPEEGDGAGS